MITGQIARLPWPVFGSYEWQQGGACARADPRLFFHPDGERGPARRLREVSALAVCAGCLVLEACRRHALSVREPYGVWGGTTEKDREDAHVQTTTARRISGEIR
jgi:WhiB family redox-sensing transcriptional regulator